MGWLIRDLLVFILLRHGFSSPSRFDAYKPSSYSSSYSVGVFKDECADNLLTCVPKDECVAVTSEGKYDGRICPVNFGYFGGYCIFVGSSNNIYLRSQIQAQDYCSLLGSRSFYFQSNLEWNELERDIRRGKVEIPKDTYFWLDAYWEEKSKDRWEWRTTEEEIQWEKILKGTRCEEENLKLVEEKDGCIGFFYSPAKDCLLLHKLDCFKKNLLLCKLGIHNSRCSDSSNSICCYSSSYDYYAQNILGGPGSQTSFGGSEAECWINLPLLDQLVPCEKALDIVGDLSPFPDPVRVEGSYYYFTTNKRCQGDRLAVISSPEVHNFIIGFMLTEEKALSKHRVIIGLNYNADHDKFTWDNDQLITYYNQTYWADGQPNKQSGLGLSPCVAYKKTGINAYSWHLIPTPGCIGAGTVRVCEMPIRATNLIPNEQKVECGQRLERGVLARSTYYDFEYDQAQYGEFPWHVAIVQSQNYHGGIVTLFACSGALIHKQFVLTSAHCVSTSNNDFSVSLGDWDLSDEADHIFDTRLIKVAEVIIHPGYKPTENEKHDIALLRLDESIDVNSYPHIGLGCLPTPDLFYSHAGPWECFTIGWPEQSIRERRILQRVETDLVPKNKCRYFIRRLSPHYYTPQRGDYGSAEYGYDKRYGFHHVSYEHHRYFNTKNPDLFCTESYGSDACVDDPTAMLVCRKPRMFYDNPFSSSYGGGSSQGPYGRENRDHSNRFDFATSRIVNAYGENRFDGDKWYVMGVGHSLYSCGRSNNRNPNRYGGYGRPYQRQSLPYQVYTPVKDYDSFIRSHLRLS